jgi:hypothetical protein
VVSVNVIQTFTSIEMGTTDAAVLEGIPDQEGTQRQFNAAGLDQFDNWMIPQPTLFWSLDSGAVGSITSNGLYTAPTGGPPTSFTARVSGGGFSRTANVAVKPRADLIDFEGGGPYPGNGTDTVTYRDLTFTTSAGHLTVAPLQHYVGSPGPTAIFAGTLYHGAHDDWGSDRAGEITITFDSPRSVHSFDVVGRLVSDVVEETPSGDYSVGTLIIHPAEGDAVTRDLDVAGTAVEVENGCPNVGDHTSVDFFGTIYLTEYGPIASIEVIPRRIPFHSFPAPPGTTAWCSDWNWEQEFAVDNIKFAPTLLELKVTDGANPNHATAIDAALRELYVEEPSDHLAHISIEASFNPMTFGESGPGKDVHLIVWQFGTWPPVRVILNTDLRLSNERDGVTLERLPDHDRDFYVTAWVDANQNLQLDGGEETETVLVHVVPAWTRPSDNDWTTSWPKAKAGIDGASLAKLAEDITNDPADASLVRHVGKIRRDQQITVTPLVYRLEEKLRNNVVAAAGAYKYAHFGRGEGDIQQVLLAWNEAKANELFTPGDPEIQSHRAIDCSNAAILVLARGLIQTLNAGEFDRLWNTGTMPYPLRSVSLADTKPGDLLSFVNDERYSMFDGPWSCENVIRVSVERVATPRFWGWCADQGATRSYAEWEVKLKEGFKERFGFTPYRITGYDGTAKFFDVWLLAMQVFDIRTVGD